MNDERKGGAADPHSVPRTLLADYRKVFRTPHGKRVLADMERRVKLIAIGRHPRAGNPNGAYMNPNAALYRAGMSDQIDTIRKYIQKAEELDNEQKVAQEPAAAGGIADV